MTEDLDILIARVVDGDLPPADLRRALAVLEAAPDGWKGCTLAFLEARSLDDALRTPRAAPIPMPSPRRRIPLRSLAAAAVALLAFGAGRMTGEGPAAPRVEQTVAIRAEEPTAAADRLPLETRSSSAQAAPPARSPDDPLAISEGALAALEARGYRLEQQRRIVAARLPDGRRVVRPVDRVQVRYVGAASL